MLFASRVTLDACGPLWMQKQCPSSRMVVAELAGGMPASFQCTEVLSEASGCCLCLAWGWRGVLLGNTAFMFFQVGALSEPAQATITQQLDQAALAAHLWRGSGEGWVDVSQVLSIDAVFSLCLCVANH